MTESSEFDPETQRGPVAWMAQNPVAANVLMLILIVGGLVTLASGIKQEVFPEVELDIVSVRITYPGASPAEVEQAVVLAVEEAVRGIDGVKKVTSSAIEGQASTFVELLLGTDNDRALNDVKSAIDRITSFPEDVERPTVSLISNRQQVISLVLYGDVDEATLQAVAENSRRTLLQDPRITFVELSGIRPSRSASRFPRPSSGNTTSRSTKSPLASARRRWSSPAEASRPKAVKSFSARPNGETPAASSATSFSSAIPTVPRFVFVTSRPCETGSRKSTRKPPTTASAP
ncbi:MAG: hypothetical protein E4H00_08280 [Myxococcales bacterium]|nr:MAG: hypothetical protein E4H00_08280 [Myxococcales bacterium]